MKRVRLFVASHLSQSQEVLLVDNQFRYLASVMRKRLGDSVLLFNGLDGEWEAVIIKIDKKELTLSCVKRVQQQYHYPQSVALCFALIKNDNNHVVVQKATELGVTEIIPMMTERTILKSCNIDKLRLISIEAAEQSGRLDVPNIRPLSALYNIAIENFDLVLFCDELEREHDILTAVHGAKTLLNFLIIIGPEGGFSQAERDWLRSYRNTQGVLISLSILRAETAAIAALSILKAALL